MDLYCSPFPYPIPVFKHQYIDPHHYHALHFYPAATVDNATIHEKSTADSTSSWQYRNPRDLGSCLSRDLSALSKRRKPAKRRMHRSPAVISSSSSTSNVIPAPSSLLQQQEKPASDQPSGVASAGRRRLSVNRSKSSSYQDIQDSLHHLQDEWATIDIVLRSLRDAYPFDPRTASEENEDERDREKSIAYDDLMAQVRHLDRSLKRLDAQMNALRAQLRAHHHHTGTPP
ncbi:hypothetical protein BCR43DRAFT_175881 [Syncephalastrum racemosum]|uniref:Uncharacterized protein n=1 Tax=Syncephalastrum racemosum TaxID=13706 RepID=A0A1X2HPM4_SYNRA|nr:hypothetical protein BCR43DRAFT_175881 [Syncephalastrum racemosum]